MKWTTLNTGGDNEADIEFEEIDDNKELDTESDQQREDDEEDLEEEEVVEDEDNSEGEEEEEGGSKKRAERKPRRESRAKKRIQQLARKNAELEAKLASKDKDFQEIRNDIDAIRNDQGTNSLDSQIQNYSNEIERLTAQYKTAAESADYETMAAVNVKLNEQQLQKAVAESQRKAAKSKPKTSEATESTSDQSDNLTVPPAYTDWVEDKDWFEHPEGRDERKLQRQARRIAKELADEGLEVDDDEFYDELDAELKKFVKANKLKVDGFDFEPEKEDPRPKKSPTMSNKREVSMIKTKDGKVKVRLTKDQKEMAERLGVSLVDYAKQVSKTNQATKSGKLYTDV